MQYAVQQKDTSWVLYEKMEFFLPYLNFESKVELDDTTRNFDGIIATAHKKTKQRLNKDLSSEEFSASNMQNQSSSEDISSDADDKMIRIKATEKAKPEKPSKIYKFNLSKEEVSLVQEVSKFACI